MTPDLRLARSTTRARRAVAVSVATLLVAMLAPHSVEAIPAPPKPILSFDTRPLEDDYITTPPADSSSDAIGPATPKRAETSAKTETFTLRVRAFLLRLLFNPLPR